MCIRDRCYSILQYCTVCNAHHRNSLKKCYNAYLFIFVITVFDVILKQNEVTFLKIEILQYIGRIKVGEYCFGRTKYCNILQYIAIYCNNLLQS